MIATIRAGGSAAALLAAAGCGMWCWWRAHPSNRPFAQRLWVDTPQPFLTQARLRRALQVTPGDRVLSVGAGSGRYAVPVAQRVGVHGQVTALDLHPDMLELTARRAQRAGAWVHTVQGDVAALPFDDHSFDSAYLICVLGQVPDPVRALTEVSRVVRPGGRVVVGEVIHDPHSVLFGALRRYGANAGLRLAERIGGPLGSYACFVGPG